MTLHLADIASYQGNLKPQALWDAGFRAINVKISHGLGLKSVHPDAAAWITAWRALGGSISTFHYFTTEGTGKQQADHALTRMLELDVFRDCAHQLDVESTPVPTQANVRQYLETMSGYLLRPVVLYTGDWWWTARPGWNVSDWTPYLWAAPNAGYPGSYPGDTSTAWNAGYGGWPTLAVMQYSGSRLVSGIEVSASAIRHDTIWTALRRGRTVMTTAPKTILDAREVWRRETSLPWVSLGIVGDAAHADGGDSYHLGADQLRDSASYSKTESPRDSKPTNDASALDIGFWSKTIDGKGHNLRTFSTWLVAECAAGTADTKDIREVIYSPDGKTVKRWDRLGKRSTGDLSHLEHTHISYFRDSAGRDKAALFERYFTEIKEGDMPTADEVATAVLAKLKTADGRVALANGVFNTDGVVTAPSAAATEANPEWAVVTHLNQIWHRADGSNKKADQLVSLVGAVGKVVDAIAAGSTPAATEARAALATALAAIDRVDEAVLDGLGAGQTDEQVAGQLAALFGSRTASIARAMAQQVG